MAKYDYIVEGAKKTSGKYDYIVEGAKKEERAAPFVGQFPEQVSTMKPEEITDRKAREAYYKTIPQPESLSTATNAGADAYHDAVRIVNATDKGMQAIDNILSGKINVGFNAPLAIARASYEGLKGGVEKGIESVEAFKKGEVGLGAAKAVNAAVGTVFAGLTPFAPVLQGFTAVSQLGEQIAPEITQAVMQPVTSIVKPETELGKELTGIGDVASQFVLAYGAKGGKKLYSALKEKYGTKIPEPIIEQVKSGADENTIREALETPKIQKPLIPEENVQSSPEKPITEQNVLKTEEIKKPTNEQLFENGRPGVMTDEGEFILGTDHGNALNRAEDLGYKVTGDLGQRAGWKLNDKIYFDKDLRQENIKQPQEGIEAPKVDETIPVTDKGMYEGKGKGAEGTPLFEQPKVDKGQLELGKSFDEILDETTKTVESKELLRKQKEVVESDKLSSSIPGGNIINKILAKKEPQKIVSSGDTKFDNQFIPRQEGGLDSKTRRATEFLGTLKDAFTYLSKVKNDPNISPEMFNEIKLEVSILKDDISQKLKSKVDKVSYAIFGDLPNIEIDQLNLGKYAGAKRLEAVYNNPEMLAQQGKLGYTKEGIGKIVKNLDEKLSPQVKESYDRMNNILGKYGEELVTEGLIEKTQDNYFPFRVLDFIDNFALGKGRLGKIEPGSSKKFSGTEKPYDIDALNILREYTIQNEKARAFNKAEKNLLQKFNQPDKVLGDGTPTKGYSEYYFDPKRNYFKAYAFGKKAMEELLSGNLPDDMAGAVKEILAVGAKRGERYIIPDGLSKTLNDFYGEIVHKNIPVLGSMTSWWKRNMTSRLGIFTAQFHARNMRSDLARIANNYPKSLAYKEFGDLLQSKLNLTQRGWVHFIETVGGKKITDLSRAVVKKEKFPIEQLDGVYKEAVEQGELFGLLGTEAYAVSERMLKNTFTKEGIRKRVGEVKEGMGLSKALDKFDQVSTAREAIPRFQLYAYLRLVEGQTRAKAHAEVGKTLINYNEFTPFEKTWMSGFAYPFWSWRKGNIETTTRSLKEGTTAQRTRIIGSIAASSLLPTIWNYWIDPGAEEKLQNDKSKRYIADNLHINTGLKDGNGNPIYIYDQTWSDDITRFTNIQGLIDKGIKINADQLGVGQAILDYGLETVGTDVSDIIQEVNPNIKMPFEVVANKGFYYGYPIYKDGDNNLEKLGKIALYGAKTENRNLSTFINLFVGQQDPTMKGLRISGLPTTSTNLNRSETNLELFTNAIFKERLQEITDQTKTVKELKEKALQSTDPEDKKKYREAHEALVIMRKNSPAYREKLKIDREKQRKQNEVLGEKPKIEIY